MRAPVATSPGMPQKLRVLEFGAAWCGPCRQMEPVIAALASEYSRYVDFTVIDVDADRELAQQYNVRSMPTLVVLRDDREVDRIVGARPRAFVAGVLDRAL